MPHEPLTSKGLRQAIPRVTPWSQLSPKPRPTLQGLFLPLSLGGPLPSLPHSSDISLSPSLREQPSPLLKTQASPLFGFLLIRCGFCTFSQNTQSMSISVIFRHPLEEPQPLTFSLSARQALLIAGGGHLEDG